MKYTPDFNSRFRILKGGKISLVVSALLVGSTMSFAAPTGGSVTSGSATINQNGSVTTINQSTNKASINWQDFSIGKSETVNFVQPSSQSVILNRVVGASQSLIEGAMNANGQVFLLNPNGVLFANGSQINVGGLVASTLNITDTNFQAGNYVFEGTSQNSVLNMGTITANNGYVALMGKHVANEGTIVATVGNVQMASGDKISLNLNGNSLVKLTIDQGTVDALVENKGLIKADGGQVYLTTQALNTILDGMVNNTGIIEAQTLGDVTGKVILFAHGGTANISGTIDASGGFVETSGKELTINQDLVVKAKDWLLDPYNLTIDGAMATSISNNLNNGTNAGLVADNDITVIANISKTSGGDATLTLQAGNSIEIAHDVSITSTVGKLNLILWADSDATDGGYVLLSQITGGFDKIKTNGGHLWIGGSDTAGGSRTWNGLTVGDGYAKNTVDYASGVNIGMGSILTNGGNIAIYGQASTTPSSADGDAHSGVYTDSSVINSGTGTILIDGKNSMNGFQHVYEAIYINGGSITSSATTGDAITLHGDSSTSTGVDVRGTGISIIGWASNPASILANGGGNINIYGKATQTGTNTINYGVRVTNASSSTSIATTNGGDVKIDGITTNGLYGVGFETAQDTLSSSGDIIINSAGNGVSLYNATAVNDVSVSSTGKVNLKGNVASTGSGRIYITSENGIELTGYTAGSITTNGGNIELYNGEYNGNRATNGIVINDSANMQSINAGTGSVYIVSFINNSSANAVYIKGRSIDGGSIQIIGDNSASTAVSQKKAIDIDLSYGAKIGESAQTITFNGVANGAAGIHIQGSADSQIGGTHTGENDNTGLFFYTQGYSSENGSSLSLGANKPTIVLANNADVVLSAPNPTTYSYYGDAIPPVGLSIGATDFAITNLSDFMSMFSSDNVNTYLHLGNADSDLRLGSPIAWSNNLGLNSKGNFELNSLDIGGDLWMFTQGVDSDNKGSITQKAGTDIKVDGDLVVQAEYIGALTDLTSTTNEIVGAVDYYGRALALTNNRATVLGEIRGALNDSMQLATGVDITSHGDVTQKDGTVVKISSATIDATGYDVTLMNAPMDSNEIGMLALNALDASILVGTDIGVRNMTLSGNLSLTSHGGIFQDPSTSIITAPTSIVTLQSDGVSNLFSTIFNDISIDPDNPSYEYVAQTNEIYNLKILGNTFAVVGTSKDINLLSSSINSLTVVSEKGINVSGDIDQTYAYGLMALYANSAQGYDVTFSNNAHLNLASHYALFSHASHASHSSTLIGGSAPENTYYSVNRTSSLEGNIMNGMGAGYGSGYTGNTLAYYTAQPVTPPAPESEPTHDDNHIKNVVTTIVNQSIVVPTIEMISPMVQPHEHSRQIQTALNTLLPSHNGENFSIISTTDGNGFVQLLSMNDLQKALPAGSEIRVPLGRDSVVDLINGGVALPEDVSQEFYVINKVR